MAKEIRTFGTEFILLSSTENCSWNIALLIIIFSTFLLILMGMISSLSLGGVPSTWGSQCTSSSACSPSWRAGIPLPFLPKHWRLSMSSGERNFCVSSCLLQLFFHFFWISLNFSSSQYWALIATHKALHYISVMRRKLCFLLSLGAWMQSGYQEHYCLFLLWWWASSEPGLGSTMLGENLECILSALIIWSMLLFMADSYICIIFAILPVP